jgi:hypothetical protein
MIRSLGGREAAMLNKETVWERSILLFTNKYIMLYDNQYILQIITD